MEEVKLGAVNFLFKKMVPMKIRNFQELIS